MIISVVLTLLTLPMLLGSYISFKFFIDENYANQHLKKQYTNDDGTINTKDYKFARLVSLGFVFYLIIISILVIF
jgi:hypothetical protein